MLDLVAYTGDILSYYLDYQMNETFIEKFNNDNTSQEYKLEKVERSKKHKKEDGSQSGFFNGSYSEIEVANEDDWNPTVILEHGIKMLDFMEKRYKYLTLNDLC